jgi:hypothetical protein
MYVVVVNVLLCLNHFGTRMPEVPQQNEKNYLTARTGVGAASEIFTYRFAHANAYIARKGRGASRALEVLIFDN